MFVRTKVLRKAFAFQTNWYVRVGIINEARSLMKPNVAVSRSRANKKITCAFSIRLLPFRSLPLLGMSVGATATVPLHAPEPPEPACLTQKFAQLDTLEQILRAMCF